VELQSPETEGLRELARTFRARAAGCPPGYYHDLMLQTADEMDELADSLAAKGGAKRVARGENETIKP
jgi:hypothetical protein